MPCLCSTARPNCHIYVSGVFILKTSGQWVACADFGGDFYISCRLSRASCFAPKEYLMYGGECLIFEDRLCPVWRCVRKMVLCSHHPSRACTPHPCPYATPLLPIWHCQMQQNKCSPLGMNHFPVDFRGVQD